MGATMSYGAWEIVGLDDRELPLGKTIGDAVCDLVRRRWPHHTAKTLERRWGLDPKTAKNVVSQSNVSERTLTKGVRAEGWELWHALGQELFGESFYQYEERRIEAALREVEGVRSNLVRIRAKGEELLSRAPSLDQDDVRPMARQDRGAESRTWTGADGSGNPGTRGSRDRGSR